MPRNVRDTAAALRRREVTATDLTRAALRRIGELNPRLNAFVLVDEAGALAAARAADAELAAGHDRGPLHGLPVSVKDIIDVAGWPTTCGSASSFGTPRAERDAAVVARLRTAGAVILGKNTLDEFAYGITGDRSAQGASRHPLDPRRMSGGSSGGSAVAVASEMVAVAVGTDTAGSTRVPAALCGVVGCKPAFDAIPVDGVHPLSPSFDHVGFLCAFADDVPSVYAALTQSELEPENRADPSVGWVEPGELTVTDERVTAAVRAGLDRAGVALRPVGELARPGELSRVFATLQRPEAYRSHEHHLAADLELIQPEIRDRLLSGQNVAPAENAAAENARDDFRARVAGLLDRHDLLALPTTAIVAPYVDERTVRVGGTDVDVRGALLGLTCPWSMIGMPAISVPTGTVDGLPIGTQLVTAAGREALLFATARRLAGGPG